MFIANPVARLGEELAAEYLIKKGYKIIDRNFRKGYGELDLVSTYQNTLIFIEVKTRTTDKFGGVKESITYSKLKSLIRTTQFYKLTHPKLPEQLRIDAVFVKLNYDNQVESIEHLENISGF
jgi:putative endonuclease